MTDAAQIKHITLTLQPVIKPIDLQVTAPTEPAAMQIAAALQLPPGSAQRAGAADGGTDFLAKYLLERG